MKAIIFFLLLSFSAKSQITQDTANPKLLRFDSAVIIPLEPLQGIDRQAKFIGFSINLESQQLHIAWEISYLKNGNHIPELGKKVKYQIADAFSFVDLQGNIIDTTGHPGPYMPEIDFYKLIANRGSGGTINQMIFAAGMRPGRWKE
jgi:hypothetical protein